MVDSSTKILSLVLFLVLISQGYGKCSFKDLYIKQTATGRIVKGGKEWNAQIINRCTCPQSQVLLNCTGFQPTELLNPPYVSLVARDVCVVKNGEPINPSVEGMVAFTYAFSNAPYLFTPFYSKVSC